ncbi:MAG: hypothetical protein ACXADH_05510 [Candidatus Kariarchaeaceae archaeon]|jgi:hypothetical protein
MAAKIIGQNHKVITFEVNGKRRYIIEDIPTSFNRRWVNSVIAKVGRTWSAVYNALDAEIIRNGGDWSDFPGLENTVTKMTY